MAIATRQPKPYVSTVDVTRETTQTLIDSGKPRSVFDTAAIHNIDIPNEKIQQYLDGMDWEVEYFVRILGEDDAAIPLDSNAPDPMMQYERINHMVLKVDSPLSMSDAGDVEGTAKVTAGVVPKEGDVFRATLAGGREALLNVIDVEDGFYNLNKVYTINYKIDKFLDKDSARYDDLLSKVAREKYFDKDFIFTQSEPLLLEDEYRDKKEISNNLDSVLQRWLRVAVDNKHVLSIPTLDKTIVDPYLQDFIFKIVSFANIPELNSIRRTDREPLETIWDLLLERPRKRDRYKNTIGMVGKSVLNSDPLFKEIRYSKIDGLVAFDASGEYRTLSFYQEVANIMIEDTVNTPMVPVEFDGNGYPVFLTGSDNERYDGLNWIVGLPLEEHEAVHLTNQQSVDLFNLISARIDEYLNNLGEDQEEVDDVIDTEAIIETEEELITILTKIGVTEEIITYLSSLNIFDTRFKTLDPRLTESDIKDLLRGDDVIDRLIFWLEVDGVVVPPEIKLAMENNLDVILDNIVDIIPYKSPISGEYVFTDAFYTKTLTRVSLLELLVNEYLEGRVVSHTTLLKIMDDTDNWTPIEKFYYLPILYLLMRYVIRSANSNG